jgi:rhamnulokinase
MIPDLCHRHLCGRESGEVTNASTTQMWGVKGGGWDRELLDRLGLPAEILPEVVPAGTVLGPLLAERRGDLKGEVAVVAPATHDTGSAVAGTPLAEDWAYVSSGTWSLVGVELQAPILTAAAARHSFTNEAGVGGSVRFLKNVMGLWILESCRQEWEAQSAAIGIEALLDQVGALPGSCGLVFPDDPRFLNPSSMVGTLEECLRETGQPVPETRAGLARVVLDSLALRYASVLDTLEELTGRSIPGVHVVGGGSRNDYLNQASANASGRPLLAGPVEATAAGNVIVQALAAGEIPSLAEGRRLVAASLRPRRFEPAGGVDWQEARQRYREMEPRTV